MDNSHRLPIRFVFEEFQRRLRALRKQDFPSRLLTPMWESKARDLLQFAETKPLHEFLRWSSDYSIGEFDVFKPWYDALRADPAWLDRWLPLTRNAKYGCPPSFSLDAGTSPTHLQLAYHLHTFEAKTKKRFSANDVDVVVEFGGGYGGMARMLRDDGFAGLHIVYDLPPVSELQRLYLTLDGVTVVDTPLAFNGHHAVYLCSEDRLDRTLESIQLQGAKVAFVSTWAISEAPLAIRERFFPRLHPQVQRYLFAFQDYEFTGVDNKGWFSDLQVEAQGDRHTLPVDWVRFPVPHHETEAYLFGVRQGA